MSGEISLDDSTASTIADLHDAAGEDAVDAAGTMPEDPVDAGEATEHVNRILGGVALTASAIGDLHTATAMVVLNTDRQFGETDAEVGSTFRDMRDEVREGGGSG